MMRQPDIRLCWMALLLLCASTQQLACKKQNLLNTRSGEKNAGTDATSGTKVAFVWDAKELPACFGNRNGATVYVWRAQANYSCNTATGSWQPAQS